jgi:endonuclease/exonuclease/phosphatase family metal-dependent hydrolase
MNHETTARLATYNLYLGADLSRLFDARDPDELAARSTEVRAQLEATRFAERAGAVAALLARERPDVVGLQEVSRWTCAPLREDGSAGDERVVVDFLPELLGALQRVGCRYEPFAVNTNFSGALPVGDEWVAVQGANVTLVRADSGVRVGAERVGGFAAGHRVGTGLDGVAFPVARSWGLLELGMSGRPLWFVNTHTEAYDGRTRDAQRDELLHIVGDPGLPVVVAGDLNATPEQVGMPPGYADAWSVAGGDPAGGFTCGQAAGLANPRSALSERIDYLFVRGASVSACRVVGDRPEDRSHPHGLWPSDHACVVADVVLP